MTTAADILRRARELKAERGWNSAAALDAIIGDERRSLERTLDAARDRFFKADENLDRAIAAAERET